jgi:TRAP-type C4-dicarboxylate transport system permease small subunit
MIVIAFLQVFFRYVLNSPLFASEEIARLLGVWLTFLGSALAVRYREHISVDIVYLRVGEHSRKIFDLVSDIILLGFNAFLLVQGAMLAHMFKGFESHALRFSMAFFFTAIPVTALLSMIFLIKSILEGISALKARGVTE